MKHILYSLFILLGLSLSSCNDWLDVTPQTDKEKEDLMSKEQGFRDVLTGAYMRMATTSLYGEKLMYSSVEMLAQHWNNFTKGSKEYAYSRYDYRSADVESDMSGIYNNLYKVIADVNGLLEVIDKNKSCFEDNHYELIKGEALAIRAFCHFDVLRLFGPMPEKLSSEPILPYVTRVMIVPNSKVTYTDFMSQLQNDLDAAEELLKDNDPICHHSIAELNNMPASTDRFFAYRQMRMNYYAVCGIKARVYLWNGQKTEALKYARLVMEAKDPAGKPMYRLGESRDCASHDLTLTCEHLLNINIFKLGDTPMGSGNLYEKDHAELTSRLYGEGSTDIRLKYMWNYTEAQYWWETSTNFFYKFIQNKDVPVIAKNTLPLVRLYEMYLIAMECSSQQEAAELYRQMCVARDAEPEEFNTPEQLKNVLMKEYNKEFYGEGQAFYAYKRMGIKDILFTQEKGSPEVYVVPLPKDENI